MNTVTRNSRIFIIVGLLIVLSLSQVVYAQDSRNCTSEVPQWVLDRQQYETTYVYMPSEGNGQPDVDVFRIPQWVLDRQQYETTYVYVPLADGFASTVNRCR